MIKKVTSAVVVAFCTVMMAACSAGPVPGVQNTDQPPPVEGNTNPKLGWVQVFPNDGSSVRSSGNIIEKRCDHTTLVFRRYMNDSGIAVIPNSPECT